MVKLGWTRMTSRLFGPPRSRFLKLDLPSHTGFLRTLSVRLEQMEAMAMGVLA